MTLIATLFAAGLLTVLLPCILPILPIVLGVSISGQSRLRPLAMVFGMIVGFVLLAFVIQVLLAQFVSVADAIRIGTYQALLLFGIGFLIHSSRLQLFLAVLSGLMFLGWGWLAVVLAGMIGLTAMSIGGTVAARIQQLGASAQQGVRAEFGASNLLSAFLLGITMGLVWVPCAGPALAFVLTLVQSEPGLRALLLLCVYALGASIPLLLIGYGGQLATKSVRALSPQTGRIKQVAGGLLILTALAFRFQWLTDLQTWLVTSSDFGTLGTTIEEQLFPMPESASENSNSLAPSSSSMNLPTLPKLVRAPEFTGLGPWHNSKPLTLKELKGKVVLVDFWTYSCINCIRTLPYIQGYWEKFEDKPFVLLGVHTPEFVFEKSEANVAAAIKRHGLTYPVAQDNDYGTWQAFSNHYWPAKYLIDAQGYIRYTHFGEGAYDETDMAIQSLLSEIGEEVSGEAVSVAERGERRNQTPETYLGSRSWPALGNSRGAPSDEVVHYEAPPSVALNRYYLIGDWQLVNGEYQLLRSDEGEIRMGFLGGEINLVLGLAEGAAPVKADVSIDGEHVKSFTVDRNDLFELFKGDYGQHELTLKLLGRGVEGYAFTFGS